MIEIPSPILFIIILLLGLSVGSFFGYVKGRESAQMDINIWLNK